MARDSAGFRPDYSTTWACRTAVRLPRSIYRRPRPTPPNPIAWELLRRPASRTLKPQLWVPRGRRSSRAPLVLQRLVQAGQHLRPRRPQRFLHHYPCRRPFPSQECPNRLIRRTSPTSASPVRCLSLAVDLCRRKQGSAMNRNPELPSSAPPGLEPPMESGNVGSMAVGSDASPASGPSPAPLDPSVGPALLASRSPSLAQPGVAEPTTPAAIPLETAPAASSPSASGSPMSTPPSSTLTSGGTSSSESPPDWAALRRKMQSLGVTRYTIEGEPGGRVVFWCLIPLAGRQAVSQRFEGEGDDECHAAQAAIRRIALWRATRSSSAPTAP